MPFNFQSAKVLIFDKKSVPLLLNLEPRSNSIMLEFTKNFTTLAQPPAAVTLAAAIIMGNSATLQSRVNANNSTTEVSFEYGTTSGYGLTVTTSISPIDGYTDIHVNAGIHDLIPGTTYHFRVKAGNSAGTTYGEDMTFTTLNIPMVSTAAVHQ